MKMKSTQTKMKKTPQRLAIMEYLKDNKVHPSATDVFRAVSERYPTMSFATVYNTMETLKNIGMVRELSIDPDKKRFDPNVDRHHHLICLTCRQIVDVHGDFELNINENEQYDFDIIGNHVEFYGICPKCKKARKSQI
jgi:Fur family transcriptional regulator, peroxide stress response regulator